jgi:hypothetical protein
MVYRDACDSARDRCSTMVRMQFYSESLHFVGLAISACLFASSRRWTADSSAALTGTALQPSLPFPATPLVTFCAHLPLPPQISMCFPDCVVPILAHGTCTFAALTWGLSAFHTSVFLLEVLLELPCSVLSNEHKNTPIRSFQLFVA